MADSKKITINLSQSAYDAQLNARSVTEESMTDAINHALLVYDLIRQAQANGGALYIRPSKDAELEKVVIL